MCIQQESFRCLARLRREQLWCLARATLGSMRLLGVRLVERLIEVQHLRVGDLATDALRVLLNCLVNLMLALAKTRL